MELSEEDVSVIFHGDGWTLIIQWSATVGNDDEFAIIGATSWFVETYGWNPADYATGIVIKKFDGD
mgnify:CR=1 FL=1